MITRRIAKTGSYWVMHIAVAIAVVWAITGNLAAALAIGLIEPTVQAVAYFLHEWAWDGRSKRARPATPPA